MKATVAEIRSKYSHPPPLNEMLDFIEKAGMTYSGFEYYYGIPFGILRSVKAGFKPLPVKYWPIFYEKITPQYGIGFKNDFVSKNVSNKQNTPRKQRTGDDRLLAAKQ